MSYGEDAQPNEVRHARKGNTHVPAIRSSHSVVGPQHRGYAPRGGRGFNRGRGRGYSAPHARPHALGPSQGSVASQAGPSSLDAGRVEQSNSPWRGPTTDRARPKGHKRWRKKRRIEGPEPILDVGSPFRQKTEEPEPLLAVRPPFSESLPPRPQEDQVGEPSSTLESPVYEDARRSPSPNVPDPSSSSTHAPSSRSTSGPRSQWTFDPKQPSLSISLARAFSTLPPSLPPSRSSSSGETHTLGQPANIPTQSDEPLSNTLGESCRQILEYLDSTSALASPPVAFVEPEPPESTSVWVKPEPAEPLLVASDPTAHNDGNERTPGATLWGCWSGLTSPPKVRSGTLVLGLNTTPAVRPACDDVSRRSFPAPQNTSRHVSPLVEAAGYDAASLLPRASASATAVPEDDSSIRRQAPETRTSPAALHAIPIQLRKDPHDKPRRLFVLPERGILSVTMRGCFDVVQCDNPRRPIELRGSSAAGTSGHIVDDSCILPGPSGLIVVLGHARNSQQVSLVRLKTTRVKELGSFDRPAQSDRNGGISAVCAMMQPNTFATGGYDHLVHLWSLSEDRTATASAPLAIKHTSVIQSLLLVRDTSRKLVTTSADCSVNIYDLASERVVNTLKLSNSVYHAHPTTSEFCTLLEVAHRELQFEVRDRRVVPTVPVVRFGYPSIKVHGRYVRGDIQGTTFASGGVEKDGCVRLWDLRNVKEVLKTTPCLPGRKVIQVAFGDGRWAACSEDHHLAFMNRAGDLVAS